MATSNYFLSRIVDVVVNNKSKDLVWKYTPTIFGIECKRDRSFNYVWLSLWHTGNLLDDGDEIDVSINLNIFSDGVTYKCCVNLVYDDDDGMNVVLLNGISWSDRMRVEVSDYVQRGKTYHLRNENLRNLCIKNDDQVYYVDWWGLMKCWRERAIIADYKAWI